MPWGLKKRLSDQSDEALARMYYKNGDERALSTLYQRHSHTILGICAKYLDNAQDCEDAAMDIYVLLTKKLRKHQVANFKSWLYQTVKNHCLRQIKNKERQRRVLDDSRVFQQVSDNEQSPEKSEKMVRALRKALSQLKPEQRKCVSLFYLEEHSYKEVSHMTGLPLKKVKSHIQNGKRNIRIALATTR